VILLDAYALIAFVRGEPAAEPVADLLRSGGTGIPSINLSEVIDQLVRRDGHAEDAVREVVAGLGARGLGVVHDDDETPWLAARLRARHYRARGSALSLSDCILLASAEAGDAIATADRPVLAAARAEGIDTIPLPDSRGRMPRA
jgi:predicted nucleic acid-binding protein